MRFNFIFKVASIEAQRQWYVKGKVSDSNILNKNIIVIIYYAFIFNQCTLLICCTCISDGNDASCLGDNHCPPECTCTGTLVRCSHANDNAIPNGFPIETSELYVYVNEIRVIDTEKLKHLKSLTRL